MPIISTSAGHEAPPTRVPNGYTGFVTIPATGRRIWWTGRVAIGLRHQAQSHQNISDSASWLQGLLLKGGQA